MSQAKTHKEMNNPVMFVMSFWAYLSALGLSTMFSWHWWIGMVIIGIFMTLKGIFPIKEVELLEVHKR